MTDKDEHPSGWLHEFVGFEATPDGPQGRTQQIQVNPGRVAYLVRQVARALCARHGAEIFGHAAITAEFLDVRERCFEGDARDAIALVRAWDRR